MLDTLTYSPQVGNILEYFLAFWQFLPHPLSGHGVVTDNVDKLFQRGYLFE